MVGPETLQSQNKLLKCLGNHNGIRSSVVEALVYLPPKKLSEIIGHLERTYCDSIGVEYMYIRNPEKITWWKDRLIVNDNHPNYSQDAKKYILSKLNQAVTFESFLQTKYVGQKRFSLEGGEALIPGISVALRNAAEVYGVEECVLGMAHRGRLNT